MILNPTLFYNLLVEKGLSPIYAQYFKYSVLFVIAFTITLLLVPWVGLFARKLDILDYPASERKKRKFLNKDDDPERHIHKYKTPLIGGLAVLIPFAVILSIMAMQNNLSYGIPFLLGLTILILNGFFDDKFNFPAPIQLTAHVLASVIIALSSIDIVAINFPLGHVLNLNWLSWSGSVLHIPISFVFPGDLIIIGWILLLIESMKLNAGSDALIEGNMGVALLVVFILSVRMGLGDISILSIFLLGSILAFVVYSAPVSLIYTGSVGKSSYGFVIATLSLLSGAKMAITLMVLALPLTDAIVVVLRRILKYRPKTFVQLMRINDTTHLHHQLLALGLDARQILLIETGLSLLFGIIALITIGASNMLNVFIILLIAIILVVGAGILAQRKRQAKQKETKKSPEAKYAY